MALDQDTIKGFNEMFETMGEPEDGDEDVDNTGVDDDDQTDDNAADTDGSDTDDDDESGSDDDDSDDNDDDSDSEDEEKPPAKDDKQKAKQNFAFVQQRQKIKNQENLIRNLGAAIGLDKNLSIEEIASKVNEVLLTKESEKTGVPVETLQEINNLRSLAEENRILKRQDEVKGEFNKLIERYNLTPEETEEFTAYLIENGKNPLDVDGVNVMYEYYQLHEKDILEGAVQKALEKENKRQSKVKDKAGTKSPGTSKGDGEDKEIKSVADLDKYFDSLEV